MGHNSAEYAVLRLLTQRGHSIRLHELEEALIQELQKPERTKEDWFTFALGRRSLLDVVRELNGLGVLAFEGDTSTDPELRVTSTGRAIAESAIA
jgi:hypothetical protein